MDEKVRVGSEAELVEEGTFGYDRARALEKLKKYQLENPLDAVLLLARCAVNSKATRLAVRRGENDTLLLSWDGEELPPSFLMSPYDSLFHYDGPDGPRLRQLATALLGLTRLEPKEIAVESGVDRRRIDERSETVEAIDGRINGTRVSIRFASTRQRDNAVDRLSTKTVLLPIPIEIDRTKRAAWKSGTNFARGFTEDGLRGEFVIDPTRPWGCVDIYKQGVFVERIPLPDSHWIKGRIEVPDLALTLSHGSAVRDWAFEKASKAVAAAYKRLYPKGSGNLADIKREAKEATAMLGTFFGLMGLGFSGMLRVLENGTEGADQFLAWTLLVLTFGSVAAALTFLERHFQKTRGRR
jgi:hypothetical protein